MKKIKFDIVSRGSLLVKYGKKETIILGELTFDPPIFYANINSIINWERPRITKISEIEKQIIIEYIKSESEKSGYTKIYFD